MRGSAKRSPEARWPACEVERLSYDCILAEETFQRINGPVELPLVLFRKGQRKDAVMVADTAR
jgi:hypothetical protein